MNPLIGNVLDLTRRALGNLLQNAQRCAGTAPVELVTVMSGGECQLGVLDRGPGISADQIETMFLPFHRVDESRSPASSGSGGLQAWIIAPATGPLAQLCEEKN